jgi:signal peptidase I
MLGSLRISLHRFWAGHRVLLFFIGLMVLFRGAVADWNPVPTGSMKPTIVEGDVILVNKLVYGLRIPLLGTSLYPYSGPSRGDVVVFESAHARKRLVKRVIGLPGDAVLLRENRVFINGHPARYQEAGKAGSATVFTESFDGIRHLVNLTPGLSPGADYGPVVVPADHYFVLGDNRDHSADSRVYGFVPRHEIVGRVKRVLASFDMDHFYLPRGNRTFAPLDSENPRLINDHR